jgi:hypothetical protein
MPKTLISTYKYPNFENIIGDIINLKIISMVKITKALIAILVFSSLAILMSCSKLDTPLADGYYTGSLSYQGQLLFDAISFSGEKFEEVASGGALNQKFPCLTKGTYQIKKNIITFAPNNSPVCSNSDFLLKGEYSLIQEGNKITFQKGTGQDLQIYTLLGIID